MIFYGKIQHVPPGTQENYNSFSSENSITEKAKEIIRAGRGFPLEKSWIPGGTCCFLYKIYCYNI
jgi:hypothetical protein